MRDDRGDPPSRSGVNHHSRKHRILKLDSSRKCAKRQREARHQRLARWWRQVLRRRPEAPRISLIPLIRCGGVARRPILAPCRTHILPAESSVANETSTQLAPMATVDASTASPVLAACLVSMRRPYVRGWPGGVGTLFLAASVLLTAKTISSERLTTALIVFGIAVLAILLPLALYPLGLWVVAGLSSRSELPPPLADTPPVTLVVAVRNGEHLLEAKISNCLALDYPADRLELLFVSDGSNDRTEEIIRTHESERLKLIALQPHHGKSAALNEAIPLCSGLLVAFSDVDAILEKSALLNLVRHFANPTVGGVCGLRVIAEEGRQIGAPQRTYIGFDTRIKILESRLGSIASNEGKLYVIRKELFQPIDKAAMDDLWVCLGVIRQHFRFLFEPEAKAYIKLPARSPQHEVTRRRRMTQLSLRCLFLMKAVFNPFRYGALSLRLAINKVVRRMLPLAMLLLLATSLILVFYHPLFLLFLLPQLLFYGAAATRMRARHAEGGRGPFGKVAWTAYYFCLGNIGVLLGVMDFTLGRRSIGWDPKKAD